MVVIVSVSAAVELCTGLLESVTLKVSAAPDTAVVGVPVMAPVAAFSDSPAGNVPLASDQAYGVVPPDAVSVAEYATPTCPFGSEAVVMTGPVAGPMLNDRVVVLVCGGVAASVTLKAGYTLPRAVGVPVTAPVAAFSDNPGGNVLPPASDQL